MGNFSFNLKTTVMKLTVLIALVATAKAQDGCKCHATCKLCGYKKDATAATDCVTCKDAKHVVTKAKAADKAGTCAAKAAAKAKAALGKKCSQTTADSGCAEGLQCGKVAAKAKTADKPAVVASETCKDAAGCKVEGVTCGAL